MLNEENNEKEPILIKIVEVGDIEIKDTLLNKIATHAILFALGVMMGTLYMYAFAPKA